MQRVINHIMLQGMEHRTALIERIEAVASALGLEPSTVGEKTGQGGKFYSRLKAGARVWPDTAAKANRNLDDFVFKRSATQ